MSINRAPFNALVDDDGSNTTGTIWNKAAIAGVILDPVDAAIAVATGWLLTDAPTVALDAGTHSSYYRLNATADRTMGVPTNAADGQKIVIVHLASGGARTLSLTTGVTGGFRFGSDIPALTATASGKIDYIGCVYDPFAARWDVVAVAKGF